MVEQHQRFFVVHLLRVVLDHVVGVAVGQEQIDQAVVVVIEELQAPAAQQPGGLRHAVRRRDVGEELVAVVLVEREHLLIDVGDEQILLPVAVDVGSVDAHPRSGLTVGAESNLRGQRNLLPLALATVREQEVLDGVVGDEQIHQTVVVDVGGDYAKRLAQRPSDVGAGAHVGEGAIAVVPVQHARRRLEDARDAVEALTELVVAAEDVAGERKLHEAAQEQIELAVVVVVEPHRARRPSWRRQAGLVGDVREGAVAVVAIQRAAPVRGDENVGVAVVVVVGHRTAHAELFAAADAGRVGDVREGAIAVVAIQRVLQRRGRLVEVAGAAVHHENVDPAVVVEVEKRHPGAHRFRQIAVRRHRVLVHPADAAGRGRNLLEERGRGSQTGAPGANPRRRGEPCEPEQANELPAGRNADRR